jgi:hypothetical protein
MPFSLSSVLVENPNQPYRLGLMVLKWFTAGNYILNEIVSFEPSGTESSKLTGNVQL